jgi:hypothetical protein
LDKVQLEVLFGKKGNSRREPIWFKVVDISSPYHALLGRPALAKFMAVPHYAYLKMKLPGPRGVITVSGSFKNPWPAQRRARSWQRRWSSPRRRGSFCIAWS